MGSIVCSGLQNGHLPSAIESFSGHYSRLALSSSPDLTILSSNCFLGLSFDYVFLQSLGNLETIESGFLQGGTTKQFHINRCSKLRYISQRNWLLYRELYILYSPFQRFPISWYENFYKSGVFQNSVYWIGSNSW